MERFTMPTTNDGPKTLASLLVRVTGVDLERTIVVQNLKTGEIREFDGWAEFVAYARELTTTTGLR